MLRLLDRLAKKMVGDFGRLLIDEPRIEDSDFEGVNPKVWLSSNESALVRIDAKAGSLLTHISMMIAAAAFMISPSTTSNLERVVVGLEIVGYLFLALMCVRCLSMIDIPGGEYKDLGRVSVELRLEVRRRSMLLNMALRWVFLLTFVFLLTVLAHLTL